MDATLTDEMKKSFDTLPAIGEYGTQLFWWNKTTKKFEYAIPLVSGGEYGGDTETYEATELDLPYGFKIAGRSNLNDVTLTTNYTRDRYKRWLQILSNNFEDPAVYAEVFSDESAVVFSGTSGRPTIQGGDIRQIETTIAPMNMIWVDDVNKVTNPDEKHDTIQELNDLLGLTLTSGAALPFDETTVPTKRLEFFDRTTTDIQSIQNYNY